MRSFLGRDILSLKDFERADFERVFEVCDELAPIAKNRRNTDLLTDKTLLTAFYQPSTRTRMSTEAAMHRLGGHVLGFSDAKMTRAGDFYQESMKDTIHMLEFYADVIAMRHFQQGAPAEAALWSSVPIINCGDGWGEHPTQVLTDLYTIEKELGTLDGLTFLLVGDMRMRTMHSILYALSQFDSKAYVVGPPEMSLLPEFKAELDDRNVLYEEAESTADVIAECDVIYMEPVVQADYTQSRVERDDAQARSHSGVVPRHARAAAGEGEAELDHPAQPAADGRAASATSTRRATSATGSRRSTASSCAWRCSRSSSGPWSNGVRSRRWSSPSTASPSPSSRATDEQLLELLRERFGLCSVKDGCAPEGSCGACTVIVDGQAVVSCAQKATRVEGKNVVTQEGLSEEIRRRWAECFVAAGASQCGYCSPGIVMKAEALLAKNPEPSRDEIAHALLGNLCRCTGYVKIVDAIELAAAARRGEPLPGADRSGRVGSRTARYRGVELALGDKPFVGDMSVPGMLHGALRFSDHPRARVLRIDTSRAAAHPGVVAVAVAGDVPGERTQGSLTKDWRQLVAAGETTAYVGDVLAVVAAETRHAAREAAALVEVEYEVLEPVTDPFAALATDAPKLHERGNVLSVSRVQRGDVDAALAASAHVVSRSFRTQFIEHAFLEPESALAVPEPDGPLHVYSQGQGIWDDRRQIASFLGLADEQVRVTQVATGGAFGAKEDLNVQSHAALLATRHGPSGARDAVAQGEPALPLEAPRDVARLHRRLRRRGQAHRRPRADRRRHRRVRQRRRQGARARRGPRLQRVRRARRRRRGDRRLHEQPAVRRDARLRRQPVELRHGRRARRARRAGRHRRLGDPLAQRARRRRALRHRAEARPGRRPEEDAARRPRRLPRREVRGHRLRRQEHRHRQRRARVRPRHPPPGGRRHRHALPLLDGDGPGRRHRAPADRLRGARAAAGTRPRPRRHRARARDRPDDRLARDGPRRPRGDRRGARAEGGAERVAAREPRRDRVPRRVQGRLDDDARPGRRRADHPHRLRAGRRRS